ncbi:MAG: ATP-binding cassette domain-containing protein [Treponema sp.]|nr:ATP-binding cassette domain-containing protein [Treponema sp.]
MSLLEMQKVTLIAGQVTPLSDVSLTIEEGTTSVFVGNPGSGKSTALKLLAGLYPPTFGKVFFNGKNIFSMTKKENLAFRKRAAFMFQDSALWANQDIYHNLELPLQIHYPKMEKEELQKKIEEIVKLVDYEKPLTNRPAALSLGEQKKIGFARALLCDPDVLFLDEPTESLDAGTVDRIVTILEKFCKRKGTLIYVSHDADFINKFSGTKYIFKNGELLK